MRETGIVIAISGGAMTVRMNAARPEMCSKCRACEVLGEGKGSVLRVPTLPGIVEGEAVTVEFPETSPWIGIVLVLVLPTSLLVGGVILGSRWTAWVELLGGDADAAGMFLGVPLAVLALLAAHLVDRRYRRHIRVARLLPPEEHQGVES